MQFSLLIERFFYQISHLVVDGYILFKVFVDNQQLFNQPFGNDVFFGNFYGKCVFIRFGSCGTTDNFIGFEILDYFIRLNRIVLVRLVDDYFESNAGVQSFCYMFQKIRSFAVAQGGISFFCQFFPVDKTRIACVNATRHNLA